MRRSLVGCLLLALCAALAGCGGSTADKTGASSAPGTTLAQSSASPAAPSAEPTLSAADLKKGLVTAGDLGAPWIQPKSVNSAGGKGEICPGHQSAAAKVLSKSVVLPSDQVQAVAAVISTVATVVATIAVDRQYRKTQTRDKSPD